MHYFFDSIHSVHVAFSYLIYMYILNCAPVCVFYSYSEAGANQSSSLESAVVISGLIYEYFLFSSVSLCSLNVFTQWIYVIRTIFETLLQQFHFCM